MARIKTTKRPRTQQDFILKPSRVRIFSVYVALFGLAFLAGLLIRLVFNPSSPDLAEMQNSWPAYVAIIVGGPILLAIMDFARWTMRVIDNERLEGPSGAFGERSAIPLNEINWERTNRSLASRFRIGNGIYGQGRSRILISPWFYRPADFREFMELIGQPGR